MSQFVAECRRSTAVGFVALMLVIPVVSGCAGGPSQEEMSSLEERHKAVAAAENKVADLKGEKARLERTLAEKKAALKLANDTQEATSSALSGGSQ